MNDRLGHERGETLLAEYDMPLLRAEPAQRIHDGRIAEDLPRKLQVPRGVLRASRDALQDQREGHEGDFRRKERQDLKHAGLAERLQAQVVLGDVCHESIAYDGSERQNHRRAGRKRSLRHDKSKRVRRIWGIILGDPQTGVGPRQSHVVEGVSHASPIVAPRADEARVDTRPLDQSARVILRGALADAHPVSLSEVTAVATTLQNRDSMRSSRFCMIRKPQKPANSCGFASDLLDSRHGRCRAQ